MKRKTIWRVSALLLAVLLVGAGCSDDDGGDDFHADSAGWFVFDGADGEQVRELILERFASFGVEARIGRDHTDELPTGPRHYVEVLYESSESGEIEVTAHESIKWQGVLRFRPVLSTVAGAGPVTPPEADQPGVRVDLPERDGETVVATYHLGTTDVMGDLVQLATAEFSAVGQWEVRLTITEDGIKRFNQLAERCFAKTQQCPNGQVAIVVDSEVLTAPTISQPSFERDQIVISGDFTEREARALAAALDSGPLPWKLTPSSGPDEMLPTGG